MTQNSLQCFIKNKLALIGMNENGPRHLKSHHVLIGVNPLIDVLLYRFIHSFNNGSF